MPWIETEIGLRTFVRHLTDKSTRTFHDAEKLCKPLYASLRAEKLIPVVYTHNTLLGV